MKDKVKLWLSIARQFEAETNGFSLDLSTCNILNIKPVSGEFLKMARTMFSVVHPKDHLKLRKSITYLTMLNELQIQAWRRENDFFDAEAQHVRDILSGKRTVESFLNITDGSI